MVPFTNKYIGPTGVEQMQRYFKINTGECANVDGKLFSISVYESPGFSKDVQNLAQYVHIIAFIS